MSKYGVFSCSCFPVFWLNAKVYSVNIRIKSEYGKIRTKKNSVFGDFPHSAGNNYIIEISVKCHRNSAWCCIDNTLALIRPVFCIGAIIKPNWNKVCKNNNNNNTTQYKLREKCPNTEFLLVCIHPKYGKIRTRKMSVFGHFSRSDTVKRQNNHCLKSVQIRTRKNSVFEHFSRSELITFAHVFSKVINYKYCWMLNIILRKKSLFWKTVLHTHGFTSLRVVFSGYHK